MKLSRILFFVGLLAVATVIYFSMSTGPTPEAYAALIESERKDKDNFMKEDEDSPFGEKRTDFTTLHYFLPDLKYRILAKLEPAANKQVRLLPTSTGEESRYLEYAWAIFELDGKENRLLLLEIMDMGPTRGKLFLAFADETSAAETYGGGRYLDLKKIPAATSIELDFNKAYNPYCAYNDAYSCPLPPRENLLKVPIRAGEKTYK
jgi:uncharacterized protein (DUF1684 family)